MKYRRDKVWLKISMFVSLLVLAIAGCKPKAPGVYVAQKEFAYEKLSAGAVLIEINGRKLTKGEFERYLDLKVAIVRLVKSQMNDEMAALYRKNMASKLFVEWQTKELLLQSAMAQKLEISDKVRAMRLENMAPRLRKRLENEEVAKKSLGNNYPFYLQESKRDLLINEFYRHKGILDVKPEVVASQLEKLKIYNARAMATNRLVSVKGTNIFNEIKAGLDFKEAFKKYNEDKDLADGGDMGWCFDTEIPQEELREVLFAAKVGEVLGPFDTEDGLHIVKVTDFSAGGPTAGGTLEPPSVKYSQITLRLAELSENFDEEELVKAIQKQRIRKLQLEQIKKLRMEAVIEFPNGTNLFTQAKQPRFKRPRRF